jgi:hypothetical protein
VFSLSRFRLISNILACRFPFRAKILPACRARVSGKMAK